jgi:hypothetical protein
LFVFGVSFGKAQRDAAHRASGVTPPNTAKNKQNGSY